MRSFLGVPDPAARASRTATSTSPRRRAAPASRTRTSELTQLLAAQAAVAIENARLYESSTRWLRQLESLNEIGDALVSRARARAAARAHRAAAPRAGRRTARPDRAPRRPASSASRPRTVRERRTGSSARARARRLEGGQGARAARSERVDSVLDDPEIDHQATRRLGVHAALYVPLVARGRRDRRRHRPRQAGGRPPASPTTTCGSPSRSRSARRSPSTSRSASAGDAMRRVVDGAGARARAARARAPRRDGPGAHVDPARPEGASSRRSRRDEARAALAAVREHGRRRRSRTSGASRSSSGRRRSTTSASCRRSSGSRRPSREQTGHAGRLRGERRRERLPPEVETALYRIVQEALTNVVKHAGGDPCRQHPRRPQRGRGRRRDRGRRRAASTPASDATTLSASLGMRERVALLGGRLRIESSPEGGTTIAAEVPRP